MNEPGPSQTAPPPVKASGTPLAFVFFDEARAVPVSEWDAIAATFTRLEATPGWAGWDFVKNFTKSEHLGIAK